MRDIDWNATLWSERTASSNTARIYMLTVMYCCIGHCTTITLTNDGILYAGAHSINIRNIESTDQE